MQIDALINLRGMTSAQAAAFVGEHVETFLRKVREGRRPAPDRRGNRRGAARRSVRFSDGLGRRFRRATKVNRQRNSNGKDDDTLAHCDDPV